ncbi:hypothetical protein [Nocardioides caricicola]|uniref:Helix-turn-helix domain-containing protein n=1 Tax=Nocardioides caricicola TaxID=634770 RepID=A0ABW0N7V6_9ACTN
MEPEATPELPPISKHHVLHLSRVVPTVPPHLVKSLFLLAHHADHKTGESRPGNAAYERWGIPYSTWRRHMAQLSALGLVRQTVLGSKTDHLAATYELLYVSPLTGESTSTSSSHKDPSPHRGGEGTRENGGQDEPLNTAEQKLWDSLASKIRTQLGSGEAQRLDDQCNRFDRLVRLQRTALRVASRGGEHEVVEALTRKKQTDRPAYDGAKNVPAAMWSRLRRLADEYGIEMADPTPAAFEAEQPPSASEAIELLGDRFPGLAETMRPRTRGAA